MCFWGPISPSLTEATFPSEETALPSRNPLHPQW